MDVVGVGFTALIICGRSGSAFSAEIGTMVVTSEIDAMKTMAMDPIELVLTPKYIAAMITLPCLTIMSNTFGILAGAVFMRITTNIRFAMYMRYIFNSIELRDVLTGLLN